MNSLEKGAQVSIKHFIYIYIFLYIKGKYSYEEKI